MPNVLHLRSSGMSFAEIGQLLTAESGLSALAGRPCRLHEVLRGEDPETGRALQVFRHSLARYIGGAMATLGGADAIAFVCDDVEPCRGLMLGIASRLDDMGLSTAWETPWRPEGGRGGRPRVGLFAFEWDRARVAVQRIQESLQAEGGARHG